MGLEEGEHGLGVANVARAPSRLRPHQGVSMAQRSPAGARVAAQAGSSTRARLGRVGLYLLPPVITAAVFVVSTLLSLGDPDPLAAQVLPSPTPTTSTRIDPANQSVAYPNNVVIDLRVDNVTNLAAYEFQLQFEPSVLSFVSITNSETFLESTGRSANCFGPIPADLANAIVSFACATFGATPPGPSGSGLLATLTFSTSCAGTSPLDLIKVELADPLSGDIPTQKQGGSATVTGAAACPTPTVTPTATDTPTPGPPTETPTGGVASPTATFGPTATPAPSRCGLSAGVAVCVLPTFQATVAGNQITADVYIDNVTRLGGFEFTLNFNDSLLLPVDVDVGGFLGG
ncbi:MAG: cohesin domain-containing protein, partial [Dehalococcoidia bacterium]|nr:cohesin domain-containing protein [Dehalococcoidia bacterium]